MGWPRGYRRHRDTIDEDSGGKSVPIRGEGNVASRPSIKVSGQSRRFNVREHSTDLVVEYATYR